MNTGQQHKKWGKKKKGRMAYFSNVCRIWWFKLF